MDYPKILGDSTPAKRDNKVVANTAEETAARADGFTVLQDDGRFARPDVEVKNAEEEKKARADGFTVVVGVSPTALQRAVIAFDDFLADLTALATEDRATMTDEEKNIQAAAKIFLSHSLLATTKSDLGCLARLAETELWHPTLVSPEKPVVPLVAKASNSRPA